MRKSRRGEVQLAQDHTPQQYFMLGHLYLCYKSCSHSSYLSSINQTTHILLETMRKRQQNTKKRRREEKGTSQCGLGRLLFLLKCSIKHILKSTLSPSAWGWSSSIILALGAPTLMPLSWEQGVGEGWLLPAAYRWASVGTASLSQQAKECSHLFNHTFKNLLL